MNFFKDKKRKDEESKIVYDDCKSVDFLEIKKCLENEMEKLREKLILGSKQIEVGVVLSIPLEFQNRLLVDVRENKTYFNGSWYQIDEAYQTSPNKFRFRFEYVNPFQIQLVGLFSSIKTIDDDLDDENNMRPFKRNYQEGNKERVKLFNQIHNLLSPELITLQVEVSTGKIPIKFYQLSDARVKEAEYSPYYFYKAYCKKNGNHNSYLKFLQDKKYL